MRNTNDNKIIYALNNGQIVDLVEEALTTITSASASVPTVINSAIITPNYKIITDVTYGQDTDKVAIDFPTDFNCRVISGNVLCRAAIADGGVIIKKDSTEMASEIACIANETLTAIANLSHLEALLIGGSDSLEIVGVSDGTAGVITLDIIPT